MMSQLILSNISATLWAAQSGVNALVHDVPVDLVEHLCYIVLLCAKESAFSIRCRLESIQSETTRAHLSSYPDVPFAIIFNLLCFIDCIANSTLGNESCVSLFEKCFQFLLYHLDVPLANGSFWWSL